MKIRADFSKRVSVRPGEEAWSPSPQPGVDRLMLDRIGEEIARATSLVRFAPGSFFPFHEHGGGEEVFVLDGTFEDEHGSYPAGTYLRDPVGTSHRPFTKDGCTLFVKLWQFAPGDVTRKVNDTTCGHYEPTEVRGLERLALHDFAGVSVAMEKLAAGFSAAQELHPGGEELLVLEGSLIVGSETYPKGSWLREPGGGAWDIGSEGGCTLLVTTGHLARMVVPA
jgi:anti-sigma factor ChrR (cupin superfamily)